MTTSIPPNKRPVETPQDFIRLLRYQCIVNREGRVHGLVQGHPAGHFAYTPMRWKEPRTCFGRVFIRHPPTIPRLPHDTKINLLSFHIPEDKDRISSVSNPKVITNLRISKTIFHDLESIVVPGLRIWLMATNPPQFLATPSIVFEFTEEEKQNYRDDKFKEDGSDLPTVYGMLRRYSEDILLAIESEPYEANIMKLFYEYFQENKPMQENKRGWTWPSITIDEAQKFKTGGDTR